MNALFTIRGVDMNRDLIETEARKLRTFLRKHDASVKFPALSFEEGMRMILLAWNLRRHADGSRILYLYKDGEVEVGRFVIKKEVIDYLRKSL